MNFGVPLSFAAGVDDLYGGHIEGGEEGGGPVPDVVVGDPFDISDA